jgi:hypothetical protein
MSKWLTIDFELKNYLSALKDYKY